MSSEVDYYNQDDFDRAFWTLLTLYGNWEIRVTPLLLRKMKRAEIEGWKKKGI